MTSGKWEIAGYDRPTAVQLYRSGFNALVSVVLASRGIGSLEEFEKIYACRDAQLSDPMTLTDMDRAVDRIERAIASGEGIVVFGDYDVDGMTASTLLSDYLKKRGAKCLTYIPERLRDGYGLKDELLDHLKDMGAKLVITVDCGITAVSEAQHAHEIGIDLVITDHHQLGEELPEAVAVVNPKRDGLDHPCYELAGVGVAFKLVCALEGSGSGDGLLKKYGDFVALGTIADVMPVFGENRILIGRGMDILRTSPHPGLRALCKASGLNLSQLNTVSVGFTLAPRINAAGRLGETEVSVRLLRTEDDQVAEELSQQLCEMNRRRQSVESEVFEAALAEIPEHPDGPIVVSGSDWHQGVAGIVASKLAERCRFPAVVICVKDGLGHGSCRCQGDFSLVEALQSCSDLLESYGGHQLAAGLTLKEENIPALQERLTQCYKEQGCQTYSPSFKIDFEVVNASILAEENVEGLSVLEPFGNGNLQPMLCMRNVFVDMATVLRGGKAVKLWLRRDGECFEGMIFGYNPEMPAIRDGDTIDIAFIPGINEYRGRRSVQLIIKDYVKNG